MVAVKDDFPKLTPEEYLVWEEQQLDRHEYIDGEVYAMSGGTQNHSDIGLNFAGLLKSHLRGSGCKTFNSDLKVNIVGTSNYVYPDLSVTCDDKDRSTPKYITYPCLIVEVLSDSTEAYDRGNKFTRYRRNPNLQEYVLVSSKDVAIDMYRKMENGGWEIINYVTGDMVELKSVNLSFPIESVYEDVVFQAESE